MRSDKLVKLWLVGLVGSECCRGVDLEETLVGSVYWKHLLRGRK